MKLLKNHTFWLGVVAGTVIGPVVLSKVAPSLKAKLPA
jgi:hypothetical protein